MNDEPKKTLKKGPDFAAQVGAKAAHLDAGAVGGRARCRVLECLALGRKTSPCGTSFRAIPSGMRMWPGWRAMGQRKRVDRRPLEAVLSADADVGKLSETLWVMG